MVGQLSASRGSQAADDSSRRVRSPVARLNIVSAVPGTRRESCFCVRFVPQGELERETAAKVSDRRLENPRNNIRRLAAIPPVLACGSKARYAVSVNCASFLCAVRTINEPEEAKHQRQGNGCCQFKVKAQASLRLRDRCDAAVEAQHYATHPSAPDDDQEAWVRCAGVRGNRAASLVQV